MSKEQAELKVGSPADYLTYVKQDKYPTAYNLETPEYFEYQKRKEPVRWKYRLRTSTLALGVALLFCCTGAAVASYYAISLRAQVQRWYV